MPSATSNERPARARSRISARLAGKKARRHICDTIVLDTMVSRLSPRYDIPNAAPAPLRLVQEFVNSIDLEHGREWLQEPHDLKRWLVKRKMLDPSASVRAADLRQAHALRESLRELLRSNNGAGSPEAAQAHLNRLARRSKLVPQLDRQGATELVPFAEGAVSALGRLLAVAFQAMSDGTWVRLKACRQCRWAFYDYSRNRAASWCSMALCGNRLKTRAYRRRLRQPTRPEP